MFPMLRLQTRPFTQRIIVVRWLLWTGLALTFFGGALAQTAAPKVDGPEQRVQIKQTMWVDESAQLDFESVRTQDFKPFNPLERLAIGGKVVWLRLHIEQAHGADAPLFMHLLPPHLGNVSVYSASGTGQWLERSLTPQDYISTTAR